jgi:hypothetical protein
VKIDSDMGTISRKLNISSFFAWKYYGNIKDPQRLYVKEKVKV